MVLLRVLGNMDNLTYTYKLLSLTRPSKYKFTYGLYRGLKRAVAKTSILKL